MKILRILFPLMIFCSQRAQEIYHVVENNAETFNAQRKEVVQLIDDLSEFEETSPIKILVNAAGYQGFDVERRIWELIENNKHIVGEPSCTQKCVLCFYSPSEPVCNLSNCLAKSCLCLPVCCPLAIGVADIAANGAISQLSSSDMVAIILSQICCGILIPTGLACAKPKLPIQCAQMCYKCILPDEADAPPIVPGMTEDFFQNPYDKLSDGSGDDIFKERAPLLTE